MKAIWFFGYGPSRGHDQLHSERLDTLRDARAAQARVEPGQYWRLTKLPAAPRWSSLPAIDVDRGGPDVRAPMPGR